MPPPSKPPGKPSKDAIAVLNRDPRLARDFDLKFGAGAAARYSRVVAAQTPRRREIDALRADPAAAAQVRLLAEMCAKLDELIDHMKAPKSSRVLKNAAGEIVGVETETD